MSYIAADITHSLIKSGVILTGRSALDKYGLYCSGDPLCIMIISKNIHDDFYCQPIWTIPLEDESQIVDFSGIKMMSFNYSLYNLFKYEYDDSVLFEVLDSLDNNEIIDFINWMKNKKYAGKVFHNFLSDYRWKDYIIELRQWYE